MGLVFISGSHRVQQHQVMVSPRGSTRNRTDITSNELFGGIFIKLVERVKKSRKRSLGKPPTGPF